MASTKGRGEAKLNLVLVMDGLRPDSVNPDDTPNIYRLRREGVNVARSHSQIPTTTRVNGAVWGTGMYPGQNGMFSNRMYIPEIDPTSAINTGPPETLLQIERTTGAIVFTKTLSERLHEHGKKLVVITSAKRGGGPFLVNPMAHHGLGVSITELRPDGPLTFPEEVGEEIRERFGPPPGGASNPAVDYGTRVVNDYILTDLEPDVLFYWMSEPDQSQHASAVGSPEALNAIRNNDRNVGAVLDRLDKLGMADTTNVFIVSDHGFTHNLFGVNVEDELIKAGLKAGPDSSDVIVGRTGSTFIWVEKRDPKRIKAITEFLQQQREWVGALYTAGRRPESGRYQTTPSDRVPARGWVEGTLALELLGLVSPQRGADIFVSFPWSSRPNSFGVRGSAYRATGGATGPIGGPESGHGGVSPFDVTNTWIGWGQDLKRRVVSRVPAGTVDLAPTLLFLATGAEPTLDGRVLWETLKGGPDPTSVRVKRRGLHASPRGGGIGSAARLSIVEDRHRYVDKSWRLG